MTAFRLGVLFLAIGFGLLVAGSINHPNEDLLHIGAVGCIVFGAVACCIATEAKNNGLPTRAEHQAKSIKK